MLKKIALVLLAFVIAGALCACNAGVATPTTQPQSTSATTTTTTTTPTTTTAPQIPTVTEPAVTMPDENTLWANYIVDEEYNYIADRLSDTQKSDVQKMCTAVGCEVVFEADYTMITDANKNVVYYSKSFGDDMLIPEPDYTVLTLARRSGNETILVYKGAHFFGFVAYIDEVEMAGFYHSAASSADYIKAEGIFTGSDANGNSVIIKLTDGMIIISLTEV